MNNYGKLLTNLKTLTTMNRSEMIKILQAIKDGKLSKECVQPSKFYVFTERTNNAGVYAMNGKQFTKDEYLAFETKVETTNQYLPSVPDELRRHLKPKQGISCNCGNISKHASFCVQ